MSNQDIHTQKPHLVKKALVLEWVLIVYNVAEAVLSIVFGFIAGSIALVGFGFDSVIEVAAAGILIWRLSHHGSQEDEERKERFALKFVGITFFLLAGYVIYESTGKLIRHERPEESIIGIVIAALSLLIMPTLGILKRNLARRMGSKALEADAKETLICAYLSFSLLLGLGLNAMLGWWWADPLAALLMVFLIIKEGWEALHGEHCC